MLLAVKTRKRWFVHLIDQFLTVSMHAVQRNEGTRFATYVYIETIE